MRPSDRLLKAVVGRTVEDVVSPIGSQRVCYVIKLLIAAS